MRSLPLYLLAILLPLVGIFALFQWVDNVVGFTVSLCVYAFLYRPFVDSLRLYRLGEISRDEFKKWFIPFGRSWWYAITHFKKLYYF